MLASVFTIALATTQVPATETPPKFREFPPDVIAFWFHDADQPHAIAGLSLDLLVRGVIESGVVQNGQAQTVLRELLQSSHYEGASARIALTDFQANFAASDELVIDRLGLVIDVAWNGQPPSIPPLVQDISDNTSGVQTLRLSGGKHAKLLHRPQWPEWLDVTLLGEPSSGSYTIAIGHDAMEAWTSVQSPDASPADWRILRERTGTAAAGFEMHINLDRIRRAVPDNFAARRLGRILNAANLGNVRALTLSATENPAQAGHADTSQTTINLSWSSRAEPPGTGTSFTLAAGGHINPAIRSHIPAARSASVFSLDLEATITKTTAIYAAWHTLWDALGVELNARRWHNAHSAELDRLERRLEDTLIYVDNGGTPFFAVPLDLRADPDFVAALLQKLLGTLPSFVAYDPDSQIWTLRIGSENATLCHLAVAGSEGNALLIASPDRSAVIQARSRAPSP